MTYVDTEAMNRAARQMTEAANGFDQTAATIQSERIRFSEEADQLLTGLRALQDRQIRLLALEATLRSMVSNDAGCEGSAGRYTEEAYAQLRKELEAL